MKKNEKNTVKSESVESAAETKQRRRSALLVWAALAAAAVCCVGGVLCAMPTLFSNGWFIPAGQALALLAIWFVGLQAKKPDMNKKMLAIPPLGDCVYAGVTVAAVLLISYPLRLLFDKLLSGAGYTSAGLLPLMASPLQAFFCLAIIPALLGEFGFRVLLHGKADRCLVHPSWKALFFGVGYLLFFPHLSGAATIVLLGVALWHIFAETENLLLSTVSALVALCLRLCYEYLRFDLISGGEDMSYAAVFGQLLLFGGIAAAIFVAALLLRRKTKIGWIGVLLFAVLFLLLVIGGLALAV